MMRQVLSQFRDIWIPCFGLVLFFSVFIAALFWVYRKQNLELYSFLGRMPLNEDRDDSAS